MADGSSIIPTMFGSSSSIPEFPGMSGGDAIPVPAKRNSRSPSVSKLILKCVARVLEGMVAPDCRRRPQLKGIQVTLLADRAHRSLLSGVRSSRWTRCERGATAL